MSYIQCKPALAATRSRRPCNPVADTYVVIYLHRVRQILYWVSHIRQPQPRWEMNVKAIIMASMLMILAACSSAVIESEAISSIKERENEKYLHTEGAISVSYFLPRQRARVTVQSTKTTTAEVQRAYQFLLKARALSAKAPTDKLLQEGVALAHKAYSDLQIKMSAGICEHNLKFELLEVEPDTSQHYVAFFRHDVSRDDVIDLQVKNGLLSGADTELVDRSLDIAVEIARSIQATDALHDLFVTERDPECNTFVRSAIVDPTDDKSDGAINRILSETNLLLTIERPDEAGSIKVEPNSGKFSGLVYRRKIPYLVTICEKDTDSTCSANSKQERFNLPDRNSVMVMPVRSGSFVTTKHTLVFEQGQPTQVKIAQASELLALASFPFDIARAVLSVPAEILQLKIDYTNREAGLVQAQRSLIEAQRELLKTNANSMK